MTIAEKGLQVRVAAGSGASAGFDEQRRIAVVEKVFPVQVTGVDAWRAGGCFGARLFPQPDDPRGSRRGGAQAYR
jgi:hypothetical protein